MLLIKIMGVFKNMKNCIAAISNNRERAFAIIETLYGLRAHNYITGCIVTRNERQARMVENYHRDMVCKDIRRYFMKNKSKDCCVAYQIEPRTTHDSMIKASYIKENFEAITPYITSLSEVDEVYYISPENLVKYIDEVKIPSGWRNDMRLLSVSQDFIEINPDTGSGKRIYSILFETDTPIDESNMKTIHGLVSVWTKYDSHNDTVVMSFKEDCTILSDMWMTSCKSNGVMFMKSHKDIDVFLQQNKYDVAMNKLLLRGLATTWGK